MVMNKQIAPRELLLNESEDSGERLTGSIRSSEGGSFSGYDDHETYERSKIEDKIVQIKERITKISLARENAVEEFLTMSNNMTGGQVNPQLVRVRQHFEKKNKKFAQETEHLQKKLEQLETKLKEMEKGLPIEQSSKKAVLNNIWKTGPLLREVTGSVISAPRGLAHMIKNKFGSNENIAAADDDASNVGQSTFYSGSAKDERTVKDETTGSSFQSLDISHPQVPTLPLVSLEPPAQDETGADDSLNSSSINTLRIELNEVRSQNHALAQQLNKLQMYLQTEINFFNKALHDERLRNQRTDELLNESIELHQAEMTSLKSDLNTIGTRMDYQYCERFRTIEENIESAENRVIRLENSVKEWSEIHPQSLFGPVLLSGANILVELLKLVLFVLSVALDFVKPLTGTRTRAGFVILFWILFMLVSPYIDFNHYVSKFSFLRWLHRNVSTTTGSGS
uniref:Transmembrane and coiled-coil domains protein 2 n=1 Tax=Syphacia muris TaxID=451379 RepID=A0A0N5AMQ9_9BILA